MQTDRRIGRSAREVVDDRPVADHLVPLDFALEMLQAPGFSGLPAGWLAATGVCASAAVADAAIVVALCGLGWLLSWEGRWFRPPRTARDGAAVALAGIAVSLVLEWLLVQKLVPYGSRPLRPAVPGLRVGIFPILQPVVLLPLTSGLLSRWGRDERGAG